MERLTLDEAKQKFGGRLAMSSLAILVEENHQGKRRVIHDATHGTKINNRISSAEVRFEARVREKSKIYWPISNCSGLQFSVWWGNISKAHRRFLHAPEERGLLACRVSDDDPYIYINKVGTFGLACASYWWSRIAGSGVRLVHEFLGHRCR